VTVNGQKQNCEGIGRVCLQVGDGESVEVDVFVTSFKPQGFECILGVNGIKSLGGVTIMPSLDVHFGPLVTEDRESFGSQELVCAAVMEVDEPDFHAVYDDNDKGWTVAWKWAGNSEPDALRNTVAEYAVASSAQAEYEAEINEWIANGWLKPYDDRRYGPAKGLIPLMAVIQQNKAKVRPVIDF